VKALGALDDALELYRLGYEIADAQRDVEGMVVACQGMGNVLVEQARWAEAEEWYRRGLERLGDASPSRLHWQLESNLSLVARRAGRLAESEEWLDRARHTVELLGDATGRVYVLNAEGLLWLSRGEPGRAEAAYREAIGSATTPLERARVMVNLAESLLRQGRLADSEGLTRELETLAIEHRLIASLPYAYRGLGAIARARKDEEGFLFYEQALDLCREGGLPAYELALTQLEYAEFEADTGRRDAALARLDEAGAIFARLGAGLELDRTEAARAALKPDDGE
jgi:tetratricopeptide (TPR) repeat protein